MYIKRVLAKIKLHPFPAIVIGLFIIMTLLGISGSSMGAFDNALSGKDPGVILGQPRSVRTDEWLWQTQAAQIQKNDNFPAVNQHIGLGEDMSMVLDVPYRSFFTLFKPQNLFFFVLPFKMAFAAKWWFMSVVLALSFYFLVCALFPNKRLLSALGAILLVFNPFTQWWYQSITLLSIGYGLLCAYFAIKLFSAGVSKLKIGFYSLGLAYFALCFIFLLYPPFLLSVIYVIVALLAGYFYHRYKVANNNFRDDSMPWIGIVAAGALTLVIAVSFYLGHKQVIQTIQHTAYPGTRNIVSGESPGPNGASSNMEITFSAPILFNLQRTSRAIKFYTNQSEASRIVAINLVLLPISLYTVFRKPIGQRRLADYLLISTGVLAAIFIVRMFTPFFNLPFKLLLFNQVQNERLAIGLVLLCAIQLVLFGVVAFEKLSFRGSVVIALLGFTLFVDSSLMIAHQYPGFISTISAVAACAVIGLILFLLIRPGYFIYGFIAFVIFSLGSSALVNPLYDKSEPVTLTSMTSTISKNYRDNKRWIVLDSLFLENVPQLSSQYGLSGVQVYPQLTLWKRLNNTPRAVQNYNRYAHVLFTASPLPDNADFYTPQPDLLFVSLTCASAQKLPDLGYVLSPGPITDSSLLKCFKQDRTMTYPKDTIYIYKYVGAPI